MKRLLLCILIVAIASFSLMNRAESAEYLYVSNVSGASIYRYDAETGAFIDNFLSGNGLNMPGEAMLDPAEEYVYVTNRGANNILRFDAVTGAFDKVFATGLNNPVGLRFNKAGDLYVANRNTDEILKYDSNGNFMGVFADIASVVAPNPADPATLTFGQNNHLYVKSINSILEFDGATGDFIGTFYHDPDMNSFAGFVFAPDEKMYIATYYDNSVLCLNSTTGELIEEYSLAIATGLAIGPDGALYASSQGEDNIQRLNPQTKEFEVFSPAGNGLNNPGTMFFSDFYSFYDEPQTIPEPMTLILSAIGVVPLIIRKRK